MPIGLSERQATKYCREYWELTGLHELTFLYGERKHHLPSFLRLHNIMGIDDAESYGKRNAVIGEMLVKIRPTKIIAQKDMVG